MAKTNMKQEMVAMVAAAAKKFDAEKNVYTMTQSKLAEVKANINEKFVVKEKDDKAAIAYASKKSENLVLIKVVADEKPAKKQSSKKQQSKKQDKADKQSKQTKKAAKEPKFKVSYAMQKDTGLAFHFCEFEMSGANEQQFDKFIELVNEKFAEIFGQESRIEYDCVDELEDGSYAGRVVFAKIKGHSKDGYAAYKKAMTEAKAAMK